MSNRFSICSNPNCRKRHQREGQRYCHACHKRNMREWRAKNYIRGINMERNLELLGSLLERPPTPTHQIRVRKLLQQLRQS